ncbi:MAG: methyltransferase [Alphaproteobacteria bacterium]|nr:methyltransferase [Alphaproteobacteria bacterium]
MTAVDFRARRDYGSRMRILAASGTLAAVKAAAQAFDGLDPSPADAVSWFETAPGRFRIEVYVHCDQDEDSARAVIGHAAPDLHVVCETVRDADWVAMALDGLPAVEAGRFVVAGAHALSRVSGGRTRIWIEASEAFGTGHHGTTRGCLLALDALLRQRRVCTVVDVGAGSGVLAIAAAKMGARATAIEIDHRAAAIAAINVRQNALARRVRVIAGDGARHASARRYDLVFANILMRPLIRLAPLITRAVAPGGSVVLSGLLTKQEPLVRAAYENRGMVLARRIRRESWSTLVYGAP